MWARPPESPVTFSRQNVGHGCRVYRGFRSLYPQRDVVRINSAVDIDVCGDLVMDSNSTALFKNDIAVTHFRVHITHARTRARTHARTHTHTPTHTHTQLNI